MAQALTPEEIERDHQHDAELSKYLTQILSLCDGLDDLEPSSVWDCFKEIHSLAANASVAMNKDLSVIYRDRQQKLTAFVYKIAKEFQYAGVIPENDIHQYYTEAIDLLASLK